MQNVPYCNEMGNDQTYLPLDSPSLHQRINLAMPRIFSNDAHMLSSTKTLQRNGVGRRGMPLAKQANITLIKKTPLEEACLQVGQQSQRQINTAGFHIFSQVTG